MLITEEIIRVDLEEKKNDKKHLQYVKMTKVDYLKRLLKLLKILEE